MAKRRLIRVLVVAATFLGGFGVVRADAPGPDAQTRARKKKHPAKPIAPKVSLKCKSDDDCALTAFNNGACCPSLCQERAVSKTSADAIEKYAAVCKKPGRDCPVLDCAPSPIRREAACVSGRCVARAAPAPTRD